MIPLSLAWRSVDGNTFYQGLNLAVENGVWISNDLVHGVLYPNQTEQPQTVILQNMANERRLALQLATGVLSDRAETITNIRLYL